MSLYRRWISSKDTVCPDRTSFFARAIASRSSFRERISMVSTSPSNSSLLRSTALLTPFLVMAYRSGNRLFFEGIQDVNIIKKRIM